MSTTGGETSDESATKKLGGKLLIAGDGSGFVIEMHKRKYDYGLWYLIDSEQDWTEPASIVWTWNSKTEPDIKDEYRQWFIGSRDGKYVKGIKHPLMAEGKEYVLLCAGDAVALVQVQPKQTVFYANPGTGLGTHSVAMLPDGNLVAAAESGKLIVVVTDPALSTFPDKVKLSAIDLPGAHGVVWDWKRNVLWALGSTLSKYQYDPSAEPMLKELNAFIPPEDTGHDLFPTGDGKLLNVTTNNSTSVFDPDTGKFAAHPVLSFQTYIKGMSQDGPMGAYAYMVPDPDPNITKPENSWWSPHVRFINAIGAKSLKNKAGARFYKVRWWRENELGR